MTKTTSIVRKADPVCFLKRTIGKAMWQTEENRVGGKDTNLDLIPIASATDAVIRQKGNMLFCNALLLSKKATVVEFCRLDVGHTHVF